MQSLLKAMAADPLLKELVQGIATTALTSDDMKKRALMYMILGDLAKISDQQDQAAVKPLQPEQPKYKWVQGAKVRIK
jgi:hypothetical protein